MKVHIVSYNLDQKKYSKSKIHILPNYEQTNLKTAIVHGGKSEIFLLPYVLDLIKLLEQKFYPDSNLRVKLMYESVK